MSSAKKSKAVGLRVNVDRQDSRSYLLTPELSMSPMQFTLSPSYSLANNFHSPSYAASKNAATLHKCWDNHSNGSLAPLLPSRGPQGGVWGMQDREHSPRHFNVGVGDLEHVHIDGMHQNKQYDYADFGHQYEELPSRKGTQKNFNMDSGMDSRSELYQSSGGTTDVTSETEDTANIVNSRSEKRKRVNPLYDAMTQSMPSIYNKNKPATDEGLRNQIRCLKCVVIILVVLSIASIAVSIYAVLSRSNTKVEQDPYITNQVQKLSQDYSRLEDLLSSFDDNNDTMKVLSDLIKQVNTIEHDVTSQIGDLKSDIASVEHNINVITQEISDTNTNISRQISLLNMTIQLQLHNISKMEGPMGPQGVANFSRCSYYNISNDAVASDMFPSFSPYAPTEIDLERNIALFASCSVENGAREELEVNAITPQKVQYRCKCSGTIPDKPRRICRVHIVVCPRNS